MRNDTAVITAEFVRDWLESNTEKLLRDAYIVDALEEQEQNQRNLQAEIREEVNQIGSL